MEAQLERKDSAVGTARGNRGSRKSDREPLRSIRVSLRRASYKLEVCVSEVSERYGIWFARKAHDAGFKISWEE